MTQHIRGIIKLNIVGMVIIATAFIFLIYSIIRKNIVRVKYTNTFIIINEPKFLKLQLYGSILNSVYMIIFGLIIVVFKIPSIYIILYPLLFHLIDYLIIPVGKTKQYIKYK